MNILQVKNLTKSYDGVKALNDLSVSIQKGVITGIIGPNGSGKSTLVHVLTGMTGFNSGAVVVDERVELETIQPYDVPVYGVTRTFQDVRLFNQMTVLDNVLLTLTERGVFAALFERHTALHEEKARELLEQVNLWQKRHELAGNLSYGQRKLLEIARALAMNTEVILFDEPFAGLFPEIIKLVKQIIKDLRTQGKTVVLIEHNMVLIRELSDELLVLDSGQLLASGDPEVVLQKREVVEAYLGE
ncbi:MAG: ABC transporter ATP-binding protein [Candidatus Doudnabacteria bacterium]|nr:ABC transporter ATP-binding protein [Candidatus Doudnabacteria bacterium]